MLKHLCVCWIFLLAICAHSTVSSSQDAYQTGKFWSNPATREEAMKFFEIHDIKPNRRSPQGVRTVNGTLAEKDQLQSGEDAGTGGKKKDKKTNQIRNLKKLQRDYERLIRQTDINKAEDKFLVRTGGLFEKSQFTTEYDEDDGRGTTQDDIDKMKGEVQIEEFACDILRFKGTIPESAKKTQLFLPGAELALKNPTIYLCQDESTPSFKEASIYITGKLTGFGYKGFKEKVDIHKRVGKEEYEIAEFNPTKQLEKVAKVLGKIYKLLAKEGIPGEGQIKGFLESTTAVGSFGVEQSEIIVTLNGDNQLTTLMGATNTHIVRTYENTGDTKTSIITAFNAVEKIVDALDQKDFFESNPWLKGITGSACIFLVQDETSYLSHTKESLTSCFGEEEEQKGNEQEEETFKTLEKGVHGYLKVDFKATLEQCWKIPGSDEFRTDAPHLELSELNTMIRLYGKMAKDSTGKWKIAMKFLNELKMQAKTFLACIDGVKRNMPEMLSDKQIVLKHLSKNGEKIFQIEFEVLPKEDATWNIPFTNIALKKLYFSANNNPEEERKKAEEDAEEDETAADDSEPAEEEKDEQPEDEDEGPKEPGKWEFDAEVALELQGAVGSQEKSDISVVFKYKEDEVKLTITSLRLRIGDIISSFNFELSDKNVLYGMGVDNFNLDLTFKRTNGTNENEFDVKIWGTPAFADFTNLHLSGVFQKKSREPPGFAAGIFLDGADFTPILQNIFNRKDISMAWLSKLQVVVVVNLLKSNVTLQDADKAKEGEKRMIENVRSDKAKSGKQRRSIGTTKETPQKVVLVKNGLENVTYVPNGLQKGQNVQVQPSARGQEVGIVNGEYDGEGDGNDEQNDEDPELLFTNLAKFPKADGQSKSPGVHLTIQWTIPKKSDKKDEECIDSTMCKWITENLSSATTETVILISASFDDNYNFELEAAFEGDFPITDGVYFKGVSLKFTTKGGPELELAATMTYYDNKLISDDSDNTLTLTGAIKASPTSLMLEFSFQGFIKISKYCEIGNVKLGGGVAAGMPAFVLGVTLKLGKKPENGEDNRITFRGDIRVTPSDPTKNFIRASIDSLTVQKVCECFELSTANIHQSVLETGFPNGVTVSYAPVEIDDVEPHIPQGFFIEGTFNVFGFEPYAKLNINTDGFALKFCLPPINWAYGMIQIFKSGDNENEGAEGAIELTQDAFSFEIEAHGRFLMLFVAAVNIKVDNGSMYFNVNGTLIPGILEGSVWYSTQLAEGADNENPLFNVKVTVWTTALQEKIKAIVDMVIGAVRFLVHGLFEIINGILKLAKDATEKIEGYFTTWDRDIKLWKKQLEDRQRAIEEKADQEAKQNAANVCPLVCFPFLDWNAKCWKVWGHWVGCPFWNSCFKKIREPMCVLNKALKAITSTVKKWANQAVLAIERLVASGAEGLLQLAKKVLNLAKEALRSIEEFKNETWLKLPEILRCNDTTYNDTLTDFAVHEMSLWATLSASYKACVGYRFNVSWFGKKYAGEGEACLDIIQFAMKIFNAIMNGNPKSADTSKATETINEAKKENDEHKKSVDDAKKEGEATQKKVATDVELLNDANPSGRDYIPKLKILAERFAKYPQVKTVPTKREMEAIKKSEQKPERYDVKGDPEIRSTIIDESPWKLPNQQHTVGHNKTVRRDDDEKEKRTLHFDSQLTSCGRMKRALDGYSELTNGLLEYTNAVEKTSQDMEQTKMKNKDKLQKFRRDVDTMVSQHNVTGADAADAYYLYNKLADRHAELAKKSIIAVHREDAYAMPLIRRHINDLLLRETGNTFMKYTEVMHHNAVQGYKRSNIPTPSDVKGEEVLENIKTELQSIVTNENSKLTSMRPRLAAAKRNIIKMSEITKKCRQN